MTRSSRQRDWSTTLVNIRKYDAKWRQGGPQAFEAFRNFVSHLLCLTVGAEDAGVHLVLDKRSREKTATLQGGYGRGDSAVLLTNGRYLKLVVSLFLNPQAEDNFVRVRLSNFQYQTDALGDDWVFRYEYERDPGARRHPGGHLHIRGQEFTCQDVKIARTLEDIPFPTGRPTLESTIRLLIEQFGVPSSSDSSVWRPVLDKSEEDFLRIAHSPGPGYGS
jgi:hypothetical protein